MRTMHGDLPDDIAARIEEAAREQRCSIAEMLRAAVEEKLARDAEVDAAAKHVLTKNAALYERLS